MAANAAPSLYPNLRLDLPDPYIPWAISSDTFGKMTAPTKDIPYKVAQLFPTDPEWNFVWHHFHHDKPTKYSLGKVLIVHERHQQQAFEQHLSAQEREAMKFSPTWDQEPRQAQRAVAIARWKEATALFSPFESMEPDGRRHSWQATKTLPLFHGTRKETCHSICESGHTFFGKKSLSKNPGDPHNTDDGYFGSGIYFTNSARYAADIYSQGHLLISWVSMREPFPFVGDPGQEDMNKLRGQGAYKHYNAHYVPVSSVDPTDPLCPVYHPAQAGEAPTYDEYVIFQRSQALPRFWIHLVVDALFLKTINAQPKHVEDLIPHLMIVLQNAEVDADKKLRKYLNEKLTFLLKQEPEEYLEELELDTLFIQLKTLIDPSGKVNRVAAKALMSGSANALSAVAASAILPVQSAGQAAAPLPPCAFGADKWKNWLPLETKRWYRVEVVEPPLPSDIDAILAGPCPIFPGKIVADTHFLILIPERMTLTYLNELTHAPYEYIMGPIYKTNTWSPTVLSQHGETDSGRAHWILMTKEVIPGSRSKSWEEQQTLAATFKEQGYELLTVVEAVIGRFNLPDQFRSWVNQEAAPYTRCVEQVLEESFQYPIIVGNFQCGYSDAYQCTDSSGLEVKYSNCISDDEIGLAICRKFL